MIDYIAGTTELVALYVIGNRNRYGFALNMLARFLWKYIHEGDSE